MMRCDGVRVSCTSLAAWSSNDNGEARSLPVPTLPDLDTLVAQTCGEAGKA
jgi:hypothetical protein